MKMHCSKRMIAALLAFAMVLLMIPVRSVRAAEANAYVLDTTADLQAAAQGSKKDGETETAGTADFFTIYYSAKTKIDGSKKTFDDGYEGTQRLNFGGKASINDTIKNAIQIKTEGKASVKIWWVEGGEDNRQMGIFNTAGEVIVKTNDTVAKNATCISTLEIPEAGTYFIGAVENNNNFYKIEVTVEAPAPVETTYVLDTTADLQAAAQGSKKDGETEAAGTADFFTIYYSAKTKIDGSKKTFDDGYEGTQRLNFGGKASINDTIKNAIQIKTEGKASVKIWWVEGGEDNRQMGIFNTAGEVIVKTNDTVAKNAPCISTLEIPEAGTYFIGAVENNNNFYKIEVTVEPPAAETTYVLDTTADLQAAAQGSKKDGETEAAGTADFFTIYYSAKTKIDGSKKTFDDGYEGTQRLNFGGKASINDTIKNAIQIKTDGKASVKIWWVEGGDDNRQMGIFSTAGEVIVKTNDTVAKNAPCISTLEIPEAGTYFIGAVQNNNNFYKIEVTVTTGTVVKPPRADWGTVEAPVITAAEQINGEVKVTVSANVGYDGADEVVVTMLDKDGQELGSRRSIAEKAEHTLTFQPKASGTYTFKAVLSRKGEDPKESAVKTADYSLPLSAPAISSATSVGNGGIDVVWSPVAEAEQYEVYVDGSLQATTADTHYTVKGLTVGKAYSFTVAAIRGNDKSEQSKPVPAVATAAAQTVWGFTVYGPSTDSKNNGYAGSVNEDGKVTVFSEGGKGKIVPNSTDGVAFYYTAIPADKNFTLRATVTVDGWKYSNGQEGFGLMATDRLGANGSAVVWNNQYMAMASKVEYNWEGTKYSMKLGLGALAKTGVTLENLDKLNANDTATITKEFSSVTSALEHMAADLGKGSGTYNIVGNQSNKDDTTIAELTTFVLEIQKNNTGYFVTYYDADGKIIGQVKNYDPNALSVLDPENIYVGFFAARNARATFSDIVLTTIDPADDKPAEEKPVTKVEPSVKFTSASTANSENYTAYLSANVSGTATLLVNGTEAAKDLKLAAGERMDVPVNLTKVGENKLEVVFTPDPNQDLGEDTVLASTDPVKSSLTVRYNTTWKDQNNLYVSPDGKPTGNGEREFPLDIYTAVQNVRPGQTIILMEGTYKLDATVRVEHGIDGTAEKPIRMVADPQASTRPVLDFQKKVPGIVHGGDHWYFQGFDVTNSANGQKGFQVSGHYNVLDRINTYKNGNSGIQISRYAGSDPRSEWPSNNLVLNCTSYENADSGYEDADGFAAKLTCGEGNVFDGCVAYHNADDGWDLFAKVETGSIGAVTIKNCVAYENGYVTGADGKLVNAGNGNGFKMGGDSLSGKHKLINSYAFFNKSKGIDSNSCPDIIVENSTSYNNERNNVAFYTNNAANTDFSATGILSLKDETCKGDGYKAYENLKPKGSQDESKYTGETNYYWTAEGSKNSAGATVAADAFVSLKFEGVKRNADGTLDLQGFLELKDQTLLAGAKLGGTASDDLTITPDSDLPDPVQPDPTQPDPTQPDPTQPDPTQPDPTQPDPGDENPKTGDIFLPVLMLAVLSAGGSVLLSKKKEF